MVVMDVENDIRSDIANARAQVIREISVNTRHYLGGDSTAFAGSIYDAGLLVVDNDIKDDDLEDRLTYTRSRQPVSGGGQRGVIFWREHHGTKG